MHAVVNDLERPIGTYLYGRRMYEVMAAWETFGAADDPPVVRDFAEIWRAADKVVYSTTLADVASSRTRIERAFDPAAVRRLKDESAADLSVGGPELASHALAAGLVDEVRLVLVPVGVGGGTRSLPVEAPVRLELLDERRFGSGAVHLLYRVRASSSPPRNRAGSVLKQTSRNLPDGTAPAGRQSGCEPRAWRLSGKRGRPSSGSGSHGAA